MLLEGRVKAPRQRFKPINTTPTDNVDGTRSHADKILLETERGIVDREIGRRK